MNILDGIGNTPLVELQRVVPPDSARVVVKLVRTNPTGCASLNIKDRRQRWQPSWLIQACDI